MNSKKNDNKTALILLALILTCVTTCNYHNSAARIPRAEAGFLDLTNWDFDRGGPVSLDGEWEFYWNRLLTPDDFRQLSPRKHFIALPGVWNDYRIDGREAGSFGYATYRIVIRHKNINRTMILRLEEIYSAAELYVNGTKYDLRSIVTPGKESTKPMGKPFLLEIPVAGEKTEIILQVSNYLHRKGGATRQIQMGPLHLMQQQRERRIAFDLFLFGSIFFMGIYHFGLFFLRTKDKAPLFFGIFSILIALRILESGEQASSLFFTGIPWDMNKRIEYLTVYMCVPLFGHFMYSVFNSHIPKFFITLFDIMFFSLSFIVFFFPVRIFSYTIIAFQIGLVITFLIILYLLIPMLLKKVEGSYIFLGGFVFLILMTVNDMLHYNSMINTGYFVQFGFFGFILCQSFLISKKFSNSFKMVEHLSQNLQTEVEKKTDQLKKRTQQAIEAKAQVEKLIEQKTNFFINLAHETKTPLTLIGTYLDKYLEKVKPDPDILVIKQNVSKLQRDMINFLDSEKLSRGQIYYDHDRQLDLSRLVRQKIILFKEIALKKNIRITKSITDDFFIRADPYAMDRVLNNLIDNAIKYNRQGGGITVRLSAGKKCVSLTIKDNGAGMSKQQLQHMFLPYHQLSHEKRNIQGIGMGLFIVKKIVDSLGADISVTSRPGRGTCFQLCFKRCQPGDLKSAEQNTHISTPFDSLPVQKIPEETMIGADKDNILIVEDNLDLLSSLQAALCGEFNVYLAANGRQALTKLEKIPKPEVIVSDIMMDEMDGYEFYETLSGHRRFNDVPLIFLTAKTSIDEKIKGLARGVIDYIYKPFNIKELALKIHSLIKNNRIKLLLYERDRYAQLGMLVSGISHEILNPLSGINAPLGNLKKHLQEHALDSGRARRYLREISDNSQRIANIITNLKALYFSRNVSTEEVDVNTLILSIIKLFHNRTKNGIRIVNRVPQRFTMQANKDVLTQILVNLMNNAIDAIGHRGTVTVRARRKNGTKLLSVSDNGRGIAPDDRQKIFQAFHTTKGINKGSGLGLYIVKNLTTKMCWDIKVDSELRKGTTFTIISARED